MYVTPNFKTKKALKQAVLDGKRIEVFAPGLGSPPTNGICAVEGPHFPEPHRWYAEVAIMEGRVIHVK